MTIGSTTIQTSGSTGNGATTQFSFSFNLDPDGYGATTAASQVQVIRETISSGAEEVLTLNTHYTVSVNADQGSSPGGSITMLSAPSSAYKIWIRLNPDFTQQTDYQNQGGFLMETVEDQADQTTRQILAVRDMVRRAPRVGVQAGPSFDGEITGDITPGYVPIINGAGTAWTLGTPAAGATVSSALSSVVSASTRQAARRLLGGPRFHIFDYITDSTTQAAILDFTQTADVASYVQAACDAADDVGGSVVFPPGRYPILSTVTTANVSLVGEGPFVENSYPYGTTGTVFIFTSTSNTPFKIGAGVTFQNIMFYWPNQIDDRATWVAQSNAPIAYPPLIENATTSTNLAPFAFWDCCVINAYDFMDVGGNTAFDKGGQWSFIGSRICAVRRAFNLNNIPDFIDLTGAEFGWHLWADEVMHFAGGGAGATISVSSITRSSTTATATTASAHGYATGKKVTIAGATGGDASYYNGEFVITVTGSTTFTYTMGGTPSASAAGTLTATAYYLRDWMVDNSTGIRINGDAAVAARSTYSVDGVFMAAGMWWGLRRVIDVDAGHLNNFLFKGVSIDGCQQILHTRNYGSIAAAEFDICPGTYLYKYNYATTATPAAFLIDTPAPAAGSTPSTDIMVRGAISFCGGTLFSASGAYVKRLDVDMTCGAFVHQVTDAATYYVADINCSNARVQFRGAFEGSGASSGGVNRTGIRIVDAAVAQILGVQFNYLDKCIDITDTAGAYIVTGCESLNTGDTYSLNSATANIVALGNYFDKRNYSVEPIGMQRTASGVNGIDIVPATTGNGPQVKAVGSDSAINLMLSPKGGGNVIATTGGFLSLGIGSGYATGAGGTVTQSTDKSTGVTLNKICGQITMNAATLNAGAEVGFTLTNSMITATDVVIVNIATTATANSYQICVDAVAAGSCHITLTNVSGSNLGEALVLNFAVLKAVAA